MATHLSLNSRSGRASFHAVRCNALFYSDATVGCALNSIFTPPCPGSPSELTFGKHSLSALYTDGLSTFIRDSSPTDDVFHLCYAGLRSVSLSSTPPFVSVNLVPPSGVPALTGNYLANMLPRDSFSTDTEIVRTRMPIHTTLGLGRPRARRPS